jgi:hypothetical protein
VVGVAVQLTPDGVWATPLILITVTPPVPLPGSGAESFSLETPPEVPLKVLFQRKEERGVQKRMLFGAQRLLWAFWVSDRPTSVVVNSR